MYHFIYPIKDSYIYELNTNSEKNFGGDNNLVLKKEFDGNTLNGVSRVLLQFDLTELSSSIVSGEITNPKYYLRLYEQKTSELSPTYQLDTFPLSQSWEDGTGYTTQDPNSRNGVSWERSDESFDNTKWVDGDGGDNLGIDLVENGTFDSDVSGWTASNLTATPNLGTAVITNQETLDDEFMQVVGLTAGKAYRVTAEISGYSGGSSIISLRHDNTALTAGGVSGDHILGVVDGNKTITATVYGTTGEEQLRFRCTATGTATNYTIDNVSVKEVLAGGSWISSGACSQSFSYESPDVNMDVTDIVNNWLDGTIPNNGLILKWSGSQEDSADYSGDINFFSSDAQSIYSPKIEVRWDKHIACSGSNTGSLTQLTIDGTKDNYLYMINLRKEYRETEIPRFRVGSRDKYQTKSVSTTKSTTRTSYIPEKSGSYSIIDVETGETLIPFGNNSLLSCDSTSNYFNLKLKLSSNINCLLSSVFNLNIILYDLLFIKPFNFCLK